MKLIPERQIWRLGLNLLFHLFCYINLGVNLKIKPKLCTNALGEEGTCMFVWECIKTEGKHLGTCVDGFLFGSCCGHNDSHNTIDSVNNQSTQSNLITSQLNLSKPRPPIHISSSTNKPFNQNQNHLTYKPTIKTTIKTTTSRPTFSTTITTTSTTSYSSQQSHSTTTKPSPSPIQAQIWPIQPNVPPNVLHTFRPPIFSILSTYRPPIGSNIYLRPTFRPPIVMRPTSPYQQSYIRTSSTSTTTTSTPATITSEKPNPIVFNDFNMSESLESNSISQNIVSKKPIISSNTKTQCGVPNSHPQTKVVGGKNAAFGAWPWQVSVRRTSFFGFSSTHRCGGAILNNQWIATAGHCVDDLLLTQIRIRVGEYDFASVLEPYPYIEKGAKKKVVHPHYNFFTYENDLALVQLDDPIEFLPHIGPICLPPEHIELIGRNATVTGWGRLSEGGVLPTVLQEVKVPIVSNDKCKNMFLTAGRHEYIPDIFMCAGYDEGGRDSCQGDSGGPLQVQGDDGKWFLAGIISWGIGCGEPSLPGVCTRISKFRQWILSNIS